MTTVLNILESLDKEDGLDLSRLEKSLKLTRKPDKEYLNIAIKALSKLGIIKYINDNFYAVKFNAEGNDVVNFKGYTFENPNYDPSKANRRNSSHQLSQAFRIQAFPTIVFLDKSSNLLHKLRGYKTPKQLEVYLKLFTDENYKNYQSQEEFNKFFESFVYEFEGK